MKKLVLHSNTTIEEIRVSTDFIDIYMPEATGDALKVYLYLLRASQDPSMILSLQDMVDLFDLTANKILQSLRYWENQGLLSLTFDKDDLTDVTLLPIGNTANSTQTAPAVEKTVSAENNQPAAHTNTVSKSAKDEKQETPIDFSQLYREEAFNELCGISEIYFGQTLSETQKRSLADCYLLLNRQTDIVEYLLEYCIERGHSSFPYIRSVASNWHAQGFTTLDEIKAYSENRNSTVYSVMRALGIKGRDPVRQEEDYILSWSKEFDLPLILEACNRTMSNLHIADFNYVNGILNNWRASGVHSMQDIAELDVQHEDNRRKEQKTASRGAAAFNNVPQRTTDYDALFANYYQR